MPKKCRKHPKREQNPDAIGASASGSSSPQNSDIVDIVFGKWLPKKEKILEEEFRRIDSGQESENEQSKLDSKRRMEYADDTVVFHNSAEDFEVMKTLEIIINERSDCQVDKVKSAKSTGETMDMKTKIKVLKGKTKAIEMDKQQVVDIAKVTSAELRGETVENIKVLLEETNAIPKEEEQGVSWWKIGGAVIGTGLLAFAGYRIYKYFN